MKDLLKKIEESSLQMVMVDPGDLTGLANLHSQFQALGELTEHAGEQPEHCLELIRQGSEAAAKLVENIILDEVDNVDEAIGVVEQTTHDLQQLIEQLSNGKGCGGVDFHSSLGIKRPDCNHGVPEAQKVSKGGMTISLPDNVDEDIFHEFISNLPHVLDSLEAAILTAEQDNTSDNRTAVKAILHNLKGESALMGLNEMSSLCHDSESLLEDAAKEFPAEKLFANKDWLQKACAFLQGKEVEPDDVAEDEPAGEAETPTADEASVEAKSEEEESLRIAEGDVPLVMDFVNESSEHLESAEGDLLVIEENPHDEETLNAVFRAFHTIKGVAGFLNLHQIGSLAHVTENLLDMGRKGTLVISGSSIDVIFEAVDAMKQLLGELVKAVESNTAVVFHSQIDALIARIKQCASGEEPEPRLGDILVSQGAASEEDVREAVKEQFSEKNSEKLGEILVEKGAVDKAKLEEALTAQQSEQEKKAAPSRPDKKHAGESTVKVTTGRLDSLVNMVGELVIAQSMVSQDISESMMADQRLARNTRHLEKITRDLQELTMSMRMVPVQAVFQKMARLVRDLSRKAGKQVELIMSGAETELDRNVVEAIADPLVHMVRNSVDHGIEPPDERGKAGKDPMGKVELRAFHDAGNIVIEIRDDGRGLNRDKILQKAIANGVVKEGQELSDGDIYKLIFHAGLSTAEKVTDISGRGVGMDVVRKNIESLRGRIEIESEFGKGSVFSIRLPLTLAVIDGQIVTVGDKRFIIPTVSIEQSLKLQDNQMTDVQGGKGQVIKVRGDLLPLVKLHELFTISNNADSADEALVVVVGDGMRRCCLQVDSLLGQQQVVIKSLGNFIGTIRGVSGGAIMGDGNVSLILDVPGIIQLSRG